jgi:hypothetical protein
LTVVLKTLASPGPVYQPAESGLINKGWYRGFSFRLETEDMIFTYDVLGSFVGFQTSYFESTLLRE